jgi:flavin reductase
MNSETSSLDRVRFLEAMAAVPGPVCLITTRIGEERFGLTASSFTSLSADPPSVIICVNKGASAHDRIIEAGSFGVSLLGPGQYDAADLFTRKNVDRFSQHQWTELSTGAPLLQNSQVAFDCRVAKTIDGFSHTILIGLVEDILMSGHEDAECLVWHMRSYRTSASM